MKKSSSISFGYLFFGLFLILTLWPIKNGNPIDFLFLSISVFFLFLTLLKAKMLEYLNNYWIKLGEFLGSIIAPVVMFIIFFSILTPLSLITILFKKDLLNIKFNASKTYWTNKTKRIESMDKQY